MTNEFPILDDFSLYLRDKGRKESTIIRYVYDIQHFFLFVQKEKNLSSTTIWKVIEEKDYQSFISYLGSKKNCSENTLYKTNIVLHTFQKFLNQYFLSETNFLYKMETNKNKKSQLKETDFLNELEYQKIIQSLHSLDGFTEHQLEARKKLKLRNLSIFFLLIQYGITLHELTSVSMNDISFIKNELYIKNKKDGYRTISLSQNAKLLLYSYLHSIPEPVRPRYQTTDPFFVSYDFNRKTFKWVYDTDCPKRMTAIAVQKLIREQMVRANVRKGICAQTFRNSYILYLIKEDVQLDLILKVTGNLSKNSFKRYNDFLQTVPQTFIDELSSLNESLWKLDQNIVKQ